MLRREFLKYSSSSAGLIGLGKLSVRPEYLLPSKPSSSNSILVVVQLFGGNDALNTIIPVDIDSYYSKYRPKLQISKSLALKIPNTVSAMHPALKSGVNDGLYGLYNQGKLAIIQGIGYPKPNFSHFRSTDIWLSGIFPPNDGQVLDSGWLGRYFDTLATNPSAPYSIHVGSSPSLLLQGKSVAGEILVEDANVFYTQGQGIVSDDSPSDINFNFANEFDFIKSVGVQANYYSKVIKTAFDNGTNQEKYTDSNLSNQLKLVARLISGGLQTQVYFVGLTGFDTHAYQGGVDGTQAALLGQLSEGISAFMSDLTKQNLADNVVGMTFSEFGRRAIENASLGTDHGAASVMFAFGNEVKGQMYGSSILAYPIGTDENFIFQYDYRQVYYEMLNTWLGVSKDTTKSILTDTFKVVDKGILRKTVIEPDPQPQPPPQPPLSSSQNTVNGMHFIFSPNPTNSDGILSIVVPAGGMMTINQYDMAGRNFGQLYQARIDTAGNYNIPIRLNGSQGNYLLQILFGNQKSDLRVFKL